MAEYSMRDSIEKHGGADEEKNKKKRRIYDRYFEGYTEYIVPNRLGRGTHIVRVYTAEYYTVSAGKNADILYRALFFLLGMSAFALFISGTLSDCGCNYAVYSTIFQAAGFGLFFWFFIRLFNKLASSFYLTKYYYKATHDSLPDAALYTSCCLAAIALADLVYAAVARADFVTNIICSVECLAAALIAFSVRVLEKRINYATVENDFEIPENAILDDEDAPADSITA